MVKSGTPWTSPFRFPGLSGFFGIPGRSGHSAFSGRYP